MAKAMLRFRCFQCGKLLGISAAKAGKVSTCPNCQAELIVPTPDDRDAAIKDEVVSLIPSLGDPSDGPRANPHDPGFTWEAVDTSLFEPDEEPEFPDLSRSTPGVVSPPVPPAPLPEPPAPLDLGLTVPDGPAPPVPLPPIAVDPAPVREPRAGRRRADEVVLGQSVLVSWALFALVAVAVAFLAGLLMGHYVWKPR